MYLAQWQPDLTAASYRHIPRLSAGPTSLWCLFSVAPRGRLFTPICFPVVFSTIEVRRAGKDVFRGSLAHMSSASLKQQPLRHPGLDRFPIGLCRKLCDSWSDSQMPFLAAKWQCKIPDGNIVPPRKFPFKFAYYDFSRTSYSIHFNLVRSHRQKSRSLRRT